MLLMGRRWLIVSPAQKLRLGQLLNMKPMSHSVSQWHQCAAQPVPPQQCCKCAGVQQTGTSAAKRRQTSCLWCAPCKGLCPTLISQSNCKTKPWTPWESVAKPTVHWLGTDKEQTSDISTLLSIPAAAPALAQDSTELRHLSGCAGSCAPVPIASHTVLQHQCCQEGQQEQSAQGTNTQEIALWRKQWVSWTGCAQLRECKLSRGILTLSPSAPLYIYIYKLAIHS